MKTRRILLFDIPFDTVSESQALLKLHYYSQLEKGEQKICVTPNPEMMVEAARNPEFLKVLQNADFSLADGTGIVWASGFLPIAKMGMPSFLQKKTKIQPENILLGLKSLFLYVFARKKYRTEIKRRVTGTDVFGKFVATSGAKIFLLGGKPGAAQKISGEMDNVVGWYDDLVCAETTPDIIQSVNDSGAEVLFVALGAPKQELWMAHNIEKMPNIRFVMGVGGAFDFVSGEKRRAPALMRNLGLEWLYRVVREPSRMGRIWRATMVFFLLTVKQKDQQKVLSSEVLLKRVLSSLVLFGMGVGVLMFIAMLIGKMW